MRKRQVLPTIISAVLSGRVPTVASAIADGADISEVDREGRSALHHAAIIGDTAILTLLLGAGAQVNAVDRNGWTPLHFAAQEQHVGAAGALLQHGAQIEAEDMHGNTPLSNAVFSSRGRGDMIRLLVDQGADLNHANRHGVSPKKLAQSIANYNVSQWLK